MSYDDAKRLVSDLDHNKDLYDQIARIQDQTVDVARQNGYDVNHDEVRRALEEKHGISLPRKRTGGGADPSTCFFFSEAPGR